MERRRALIRRAGDPAGIQSVYAGGNPGAAVRQPFSQKGTAYSRSTLIWSVPWASNSPMYCSMRSITSS